jgi:hypothetical protein
MKLQYLDSARRQFQMYKQLAEKAMAQVEDKDLNWQPNEDSNSIATIVKHLWGNMLSRWTEFLTTDGEKPWRQRDAEFENDITSREELMHKWEEGWKCLFKALNSITDADLDRIVYIRNEGDTLLNAITRQVSHYCYHVGQIVYIAKICNKNEWESLSIPKHQSKDYNTAKFAQQKEVRHFTEEWTETK